MADDRFWLLGTVAVPEEKKEEFNGYVLDLLEKCGIRKTEEMELDGKTLTVLSRPAPDADGIVSFDYSIFEQIKREPGTYDTNTCKLQAADQGYNEYWFAMNLVMTLQEVYSEGRCCVMKNDEPYKYIGVGLDVIYSLTGKRFTVTHRGRLFDMELLFHRNGIEVSSHDMLDCMIYNQRFIAYVDIPQVSAYMNMDSDTIEECQEQFRINSRAEIADAAHVGRRAYLYPIIQRLVQEDGENFLRFLSTLSISDISRRRELAGSSEPYGTVAEASLYMHSASIIQLYAQAKNMDFWDVWDLLPDPKYGDVIWEPEPNEMAGSGCNFYEISRRSDEDEFLEWWDGENLHLSAGLMEEMEHWKETYGRAEDLGPDEIVPFLADIVYDLEHEWGCRFVDRAIVDLMLAHTDDPSYRRAVRTIRNLMDEDVDMFPELTRSQALAWVVRENRSSDEKIFLSAFLSLLGNGQQRKRLLGF